MKEVLCVRCGAPSDAPVVVSEIEEIVKSNIEPLCLECLEKRLGRGLRRVDLAEIPENRILRTMLSRVVPQEKKILDVISQALDIYHQALRAKEGSGTASIRLASAIEQLLDKPYQEKEKEEQDT